LQSGALATGAAAPVAATLLASAVAGAAGELEADFSIECFAIVIYLTASVYGGRGQALARLVAIILSARVAIIAVRGLVEHARAGFAMITDGATGPVITSPGVRCVDAPGSDVAGIVGADVGVITIQRLTHAYSRITCVADGALAAIVATCPVLHRRQLAQPGAGLTKVESALGIVVGGTLHH